MTKQGRQEVIGNGGFHLGEGCGVAVVDSLGELPFMLEAFLEGSEGRLGVVFEGLLEELKGGIPSSGFGGEPARELGRFTDESTQEPVAGQDLEGEVVQALEVVFGGYFSVCWGYEDGLLGTGEVAKLRANSTEFFPVFAELAPGATCIAIVGEPDVEDSGELGLEVSNNGKAVESIEDHGEGTALGDTSLAEKAN